MIRSLQRFPFMVAASIGVLTLPTEAQSSPLAPAILASTTTTTDDVDNDGLVDTWEKSQGLSTKRATLILVPVLRPGTTKAQIQPTLDKVVAFFGRVPNKNVDGSKGIDVVIRWGNTLAAADATTDYHDLRTKGMPASLIGKGHGVLIGTGGGGGQTSGVDWSGTANDWHVVAHELGHQLGLDHSPKGKPSSPLYASIMNYDYNYQFNGSGDAVQFSTGKFRYARLNESKLGEALLYPIEDLQFLAKAPYNFSLQKFGPDATLVDWNRNGKFGETGLKVDINGGYALSPRDRVDSTKIAGGFALASYKSRIVSVYADNTAKSTVAYKQPSLSTSNPGWLSYQVHGTSGPCTATKLAYAQSMTGDPHAVSAFGKLFVTQPLAAGYNVLAYKAGTIPANGCFALANAGAASELHAAGVQPVLVKTSTKLYVVSWNPSTKRVQWREVIASATSNTVSLGPVRDLTKSNGTPLTSVSAVGGTFNTKTGRMVLAITEPGASFKGWMKMVELVMDGERWKVHSLRPMVSAVESAGNSTLSRPTILFDGRASAGSTGQYTIYARAERTDPKVPAATSVVKLNPGSGTTPDVWTKQLMLNEWAITVSPPAGVLFKDDVVWGFRVWKLDEQPFHNMLQLFTRASGATDQNVSDMDDVTFIATQGLKLVRR